MASPMMQQYLDAKRACGDALLLFRMGDFYEVFFEDAKSAARVLGITLTARDKGDNPIPMAGFPHHQLEGYLGKLIAAGLRVAVCDQVEDPRQAKGLVKREITRVVSPGTLTDDGLLDPRESNYLVAVAPVVGKGKAGDSDAPSVGLAWVELSTGHFFAESVPAGQLGDELARINPAECLLREEAIPPPDLNGATVTRRPAWAFAAASAQEALNRHFGTRSLEGFGFDWEEPGDQAAIAAAGAIVDYLTETQRTSLEHLDRLVRYGASRAMVLDQFTRRSLELTRTLREGKREGSLLAVMDRTTSPMGSRLLGSWVANPLSDRATLESRQQAVAELVADPSLIETIAGQLAEVYDLERLLTRVTTLRATPRDLSCVGRTLAALPKLKARLTGRKSPLLSHLETQIDLCPPLADQLRAALAESCPLVASEGGFIREGFHEPLDRLRELAAGGKQWIAQYQAEQTESTGIPNLKVGYNKVFGYYIEITNAHKSKVPAEYSRKQTLKNAERYITPKLKEYEEQVVAADEKAKDLELKLFAQLRDFTAEHAPALRRTAAALAQLDVLAGLAKLARERNYVQPTLVDEPTLDIRDGRHPVLDLILEEGTFVPNDALADEEAGRCLLITGPNMAGKSTYIRQVALITLLAQIGSFVPATKAAIGIADRLFARVGASDELARGQSTFMVEMTEAARILNTATPRSLVILDEIGRGTSTYDGLSLAWAIVEHLHDRVGCRTFFATHYHELTDLAKDLPGVANLNVAVREWNETVVFLHKIVAGAADKSYGIHVARLAGVPPEVNERAKQVLAQLEGERLESRPKVTVRRPKRDLQLTLFGPAEHPLLDKIRELDVDQLRPLEALELLAAWQVELREM